MSDLTMRSIHSLLPFAIILCSGLLKTQDHRFQNGRFEDKELGISLRLPPGFVRLPVEKDRYGVVLGHFLHAKTLAIPKRRFPHHPSFRVLRFPRSGAGIEPCRYSKYDDYLHLNVSGTLAVSAEEPLRIRDVEVRRQIVRRRAFDLEYVMQVWTFERDDVAFVLESTCAKAHQDKLGPAITSAMRSFKFLTPDKSASAQEPDPVVAPMWRAQPERWQKLTVDQRASERARHEQLLHQHARRQLLPGWRAIDHEAGLIVTDAGDRFVGNAGRAAAACRRFLVSHFDPISDERVRRPVIRIFAERAHKEHYRSRSARESAFVPEIDEICLVEDESGTKVGQLRDLHGGLWHHFLEDKRHGAARHLPAWINEGMAQFLALSRPGGSQLIFEVSNGERDEINSGRRGGQLLSVQDLLRLESGKLDLNEGGSERNLRYQRGRLVRFFQARQQQPRFDFLVTYVTAALAGQSGHPLAAVHPGAGKKAEPSAGKETAAARQRFAAALADTLQWPQAQASQVEKDWQRFLTQL